MERTEGERVRQRNSCAGPGVKQAHVAEPGPHHEG